MDHDYELASFERMDHHIFNKEKLSKPASYYASIRPRNNAAEEGARAAKEAAKEAKAESA
jgi:NADH-quinone oxidoreductase subunit I